MSHHHLAEELYQELAEIPVIDVHTHLVGNQLGARGLQDVLLYHMAVSDLYSAGCPSGARLTQYPGWPDDAEAHGRIKEALPFLPYVQNTHISWGVRIILKDLYGWEEPVTASNWQKLDGMIRERAADKAWHREILRKVNIRRTGSENARRANGEGDDILQYALEWAFFTRCQWGEYDTALYELERCWGKTPSSPMPIGSGGRPKTDRMIHTVADVHAAVEHYVENIPYDIVKMMATHISTDLNINPVTEAQMIEALKKRDSAGPRERDTYAAFINEAFLTALVKYADKLVFQFSYAAEPLPFETASRVTQESIAQVAAMITRHPKIRFQCFVSSRHANQSLCTMCRELPNLSLAGYWWHNFFPGTIRDVMEERMDMVPVNKQVGFFSDAYCVEWAYGKSILVRKQLARVLAEKIDAGQYTKEYALEYARQTMFETPQKLLGMTPAW